MADKLLPSKFWFFAILYAVQLSNYLPVKTDTDSLTTPFFEAYRKKQTTKNSCPSSASPTSSSTTLLKVNTLSMQTAKAFLVGND